MARRSKGRVPPIVLDRRRDAPLFRQIENGLREVILSGRLPAGNRLPSSRVLAATLDVSRTTVLLAFDRLVAAGLLESIPGGGTYVVDDPPLRLDETPEGESVPPSRPLSSRGAAMLEETVGTPEAGVPPRPFSLEPRIADFPFDVWAACQNSARRTLREGEVVPDAAGHPRLRAAAADFLRLVRAVPAHQDRLVVVGSLREALHLLGTLLVDPGDTFWHADPGHTGHRSVLEAVGARPVAIGMDEDGIDVEEVRRLAPDAALGVLSPGGEFPLARRTRRARRAELLDWAREADAYILEDDRDPAAFLCGRASPTLAAQDPDGRVIYVAALTEILAPAIRIGFMVLPADLVAPVLDLRRKEQLRGVLEGPPPVLDQVALADFLVQGHLERIVRGRGPAYRERHGRLLELLREMSSETCRIDPADELSYVVAWLPEGTDDVAVSRRLSTHGVDTVPVSVLYAGASARPGLVLGSASFASDDIESGVRRLAEGLRSA